MRTCRNTYGRYGMAAAAALCLAFVAAKDAGAQAKLGERWITLALPAEPPDLDGCNSSRLSMGRIVRQNIVETLIEKNPADGTLKPRLATAWEQTDPNTWKITLRQGVTFHDGTPMTAATVKKALDRTINNKLIVCEDRNKVFGDVEATLTPLDDHTLQIKTAKPEPILPMRLVGPAIVGPATAIDKFSLAPVGTGPYVFEKWDAGQEIRVKRNDKYWGAKPQVEGVRYIWRNESAVRAAMVAVNEADIAQAIAPQDATDPKMDFTFLNSETTYLRIDQTRPPLDDKRVRFALNYAIDREAMRNGLHGKGTIDATQMVIPSIPGHDHGLDKMVRPYDPAKAKQLLAEAKAAGVPVDTEILLIGRPYGYPAAIEEMEAILTTYKAIGLNVKLINLEQGQLNKYNNKPYPEDRPANLLQSSHDNNLGDPVFSVFFKYACDGNNSAFCDPALDKQIAAASGLGGEARVKAWQEVFRHLYEDIVPEVWMFHMVGYVRVNPRINFVPDVTSNSEIRIQEITFK